MRCECRRKWRSEFADPTFFIELVEWCQAEGVKLVIASFGVYETIQAYLDLLVPGAFNRSTISTPSTVGSRDGWSVDGGKNKQITKLSVELGIPLDRVLFFDGTPSGLGALIELSQVPTRRRVCLAHDRYWAPCR